MVRLLPHFPKHLWSPPSEFQSHNGAIATRFGMPFPFRHAMFQSHNGAIATRDDSVGHRCEVRFQSHNGAIATSGQLQRSVAAHSFNPTMVRLLQAS